MRRVGLVLLLLAGCAGDSTEQRARTVCTAYCDCFVTAGGVDACVEDCIPDIPPVSDECLQCVYESSQTCATLDEQCTDLCSGNTL